MTKPWHPATAEPALSGSVRLQPFFPPCHHLVQLSFPTNHQPRTAKNPILRRPRSKTPPAESTLGIRPPRAPIILPPGLTCSLVSGHIHQTTDARHSASPIPYHPTEYITEQRTHPLPSLLLLLLKLSNLVSLLFQPRSSPPFTLHPSPFTRSLFNPRHPSCITSGRGSLTSPLFAFYHNRTTPSFSSSCVFPFQLATRSNSACPTFALPTSHFRINDTIDSNHLLNTNPTSTPTV